MIMLDSHAISNDSAVSNFYRCDFIRNATKQYDDTIQFESILLLSIADGSSLRPLRIVNSNCNLQKKHEIRDAVDALFAALRVQL